MVLPHRKLHTELDSLRHRDHRRRVRRHGTPALEAEAITRPHVQQLAETARLHAEARGKAAAAAAAAADVRGNPLVAWSLAASARPGGTAGSAAGSSTGRPAGNPAGGGRLGPAPSSGSRNVHEGAVPSELVAQDQGEEAGGGGAAGLHELLGPHADNVHA